VRPLPSLPAGSACAQVDCLFVFLTLPLLRVVKWFLLFFCLMSCSGARVAEQRRILSRSSHYNRQVMFIAIARSFLSLVFMTRMLSLLNCQCQTAPSLSTLNPFIIRSGYGNTPWVVPPHLMGIMGGPGIGCC
jgi:hypothetical protein